MDAIGVIRNTEKAGTGEIAEKIRLYLEKKGTGCHISADGSDLPPSCSKAVVLGGDGTLLRAAKVVLKRQLPLLGVNLGNLGYLAEIDTEGLEPALDRLLEGAYSIERRMMLHGKVIKTGRTAYEDIALNDIVLTRILPLRSFRILNHVNGEFLNEYTGDGEIISTATGSTGYNLSVGGPIVSPEAELIVMTPHAPHSLISRRIVLSGSSCIRVEIGEGRTGREEEAVSVWYDGSGDIRLGTGDSIEIRRSDQYTNIIKLKKISFLEVLRRKMADE